MNPYIEKEYETHFKLLLDEAESWELLYRHDRIIAFEALGDKRAVDFLLTVLNHTEPLLRIRAIRALGKLADTRAWEPLRRMLIDPDKDVRRNAVISLAGLGDETVIPLIVTWLIDTDVHIQEIAAQCLRNFETKKALEALSIQMETNYQKSSIWTVDECQRAFVDARDPAYDKLLIKLLSSGRIGNDETAIERMGLSDDPEAVPALTTVLTKRAWGAGRTIAAMSLARLRDARATGPLKDCLNATITPESEPVTTPGPAFRGLCAWALGCIGDRASIDLLLDMLTEKSTLTKSRVLMALGRLGDNRTFEAMSRAMSDKDSQVRAHAIWALGELRDSRAIELIRPKLNDPVGRLRAQAAWALARLGDIQSHDSIMTLMDDPDGHVRAWSAKALGRFKDARAVPLLLRSLCDRDGLVRAAVIWALGEIGGRDVLDTVLKFGADEIPEVRGEVVRAMAKNRYGPARPAMERLANDNSPLLYWDEKADLVWVTVSDLAEDGLRKMREVP